MGVKIHPHPGKILAKDFLKRNRLSANALALALRVPANRITGIINGDRAVTADTALRLGRYFDMLPNHRWGGRPPTTLPRPGPRTVSGSRPRSGRATRRPDWSTTNGHGAGLPIRPGSADDPPRNRDFC